MLPDRLFQNTPALSEAAGLPLWHDTAVPGEVSPRLKDEIACDIAIVGAGFTGLRAALHLAEAGASVVLVDALEVGAGASGRTGGQVNPMLPFAEPEQIKEIVGPEQFERLAAASLGAADALFELIQRYKIACNARKKGWLRVDHSVAARRRARRIAEAWNSYGADLHWVSGAELEALSGTEVYRSGILAQHGGAVQPLSLARGLALAARRAGVAIFGRSPVSAMKRIAGRWHLRCPDGGLRAEEVLFCTNGYSGALPMDLNRTILPLCPIQIASAPLDDAQLAAILPYGHTISDTRRVVMYARREPGNRIVYGGHGRKRKDGAIVGHDWLIRDASRVFPSLRGVSWDYRWGGQIALTSDRLPHIHNPAPGLWAALGYNGRGVAMAHVAGRTLAQAVLGQARNDLDLPITDLRPMRLRGLQKLGGSAAFAAMRMLDAFESRWG